MSDCVDRFVLFPIQYEKLWRCYKLNEHAKWTTPWSEVKTRPYSAAQQAMVARLHTWFMFRHQYVKHKQFTELVEAMPIPEARCFIGHQYAIQAQHNDARGLLLSHYNEADREAAIGIVREFGEDRNWSVGDGDLPTVMITRVLDEAAALAVESEVMRNLPEVTVWRQIHDDAVFRFNLERLFFQSFMAETKTTLPDTVDEIAARVIRHHEQVMEELRLDAAKVQLGLRDLVTTTARLLQGQSVTRSPWSETLLCDVIIDPPKTRQMVQLTADAFSMDAEF